MKLKKSTVLWTLAAALLIIVPAGVLFGTWWVIPWLSSQVGRGELQSYALIGDLFGFAAAVFAGIGLVGVALALLFDTLERKRARRPFVILTLPEDGVEIRRGEWTNGTLDVRLRLAGQLKNDSQDPALNVVARSSSLPGLGDGVSRDVSPGPLAAGASFQAVLVSRLHGTAAETFLRRIRSGERHEITLESTYESLNRSKWLSSLRVELYSDSSADQARLGEGLNLRTGVFIDGDTESTLGPDAVVLRAKIVEGSWRQDAV